MPKLRIPESHREGFKSLAKLSEADFKSLIEAIPNLKGNFSPNNLSSKLSKASGIDENITKHIARVLFSIYSLKEKFREDHSKLTNELLIALKDTNVEIGNKSTWDKLEERLNKMLSFDKDVGNTFKALKLLTEYDRLFLDSKIITDIRPAFNDTDDLNTNTALITHTLKIEYFSKESRKDVFFSMNSDDLDELKKHIERAKKKEEIIKEKLKDNFTLLTSTE